MIDTHCHLNFEAFENITDLVIESAYISGISRIVVPGTDLPTSSKAIQLAKSNENIYAAVGIHPHHAFEISDAHTEVPAILDGVGKLLDHEEVVAIGEIGLDKHIYTNTIYENYQLTDTFLDVQQRLFTHQLFLGAFMKKAVIIHNREATDWLLDLMHKHWNDALSGKTVFHCCEANEALLSFAKERNIYIGVDGDVTYSKKKAAFIKEVPLELLVLETDAPFLTPEPVKQTKKFPNEPANLMHTAKFVAELKGITVEELDHATTQNAKELFGLN